MTPRLVFWTVGLLSVALTAPAEIYRWTDDQGRVHYTEDLGRVPARHRDAAKQSVGDVPGADRIQTFRSPPVAPVRRRGAVPAAPGLGGGRVHRIEVERAGTSLFVPVRLNGRTVAPFVLDTGASYVVIPRALADRAGIRVGRESRKLRFGTANGTVEHPVVSVDSVELGTARAEGVPAAISDTLPYGLLGLSFFHRFTYQIDAAAGVVTLIENDMAETGQIRGGRSEAQWRNEFRTARGRIAAVEAERRRTPSSHSRKFRRMDEERAALEHQLELLEGEADRARVPDAWRH